MPLAMNSEDSIFAPATGSGRTAVAIIRVSGRGRWRGFAPNRRQDSAAAPGPSRAFSKNPATHEADRPRPRHLVSRAGEFSPARIAANFICMAAAR